MAKKKSEGINFFQKYLTIWVFICMVVGVMRLFQVLCKHKKLI